MATSETNKMELTVRSPSSGEVLAKIATHSAEDVRRALGDSRRAQKEWAALSFAERREALARLRETLLDAKNEIVDLITKENGKPRFEALTAEFMSVLDLIRYFEKVSEKTLRRRALALDTELLPHRRSYVEWAPLGVVAIISPWNFPWLLPFGEIVMALAAGNGVVLKPSEVTPLTGLKIQEICERAGLPKGLVAVVVGDGTVGAELIRAKPDKVFFTGSVATGKRVMTAAAEHLIPVNLELGSKDAMIVLEDADLDLASSAALWGANFNLGQACASIERLLVHESVSKEFTRLLVEKMKRLEHGRDIGAITFEKQKATYEAHFGEARNARVEILSGGEWTNERRSHQPTLVTGQSIESLKIYNEETFGPFVAMSTFTSDEEAIRKANATPYGLTAAVFSRHLYRAEWIASRLETGTIMINEVVYTAGIAGTPWGGWKESGFGRTHHADGLYEFAQMRHVHTQRFSWFNMKSLWWYPYTPHQYKLFEAIVDRHRPGVFAKARAWARVAMEALKMLKREPRI